MRSGVDIKTEQTLLGHKNMATTEKYLKSLRLDDLRQKVESSTTTAVLQRAATGGHGVYLSFLFHQVKTLIKPMRFQKYFRHTQHAQVGRVDRWRLSLNKDWKCQRGRGSELSSSECRPLGIASSFVLYI